MNKPSRLFSNRLTNCKGGGEAANIDEGGGGYNSQIGGREGGEETIGNSATRDLAHKIKR